jgi:DNA-binding NarL/FixJ family response regulator
MTKVAIVEDDARFRRSLRRVIESGSDYACIAAYPSGAEALDGIAANPPDIVLMDLKLPGLSGAEVTARLKARLPGLIVIVLTVYNDAESIFKALRAGASGYLLKQATAREILDALRNAQTGGAPMTNEIARKVIATFHEPAPPGADATPLAPREREVLDLVAQGYANKEIADKLAITIATVCWYLHEIYRKLHVRSRVQAINKLRQSQNRPGAP